ncbi:MAG TPA: NAD-dependent epimerase/dehydratase family protein, partial [Bacteroidia bacterium]|nr:NAD-dependent epimerase/dehydratase family protein [Bacteroidia bacterium]
MYFYSMILVTGGTGLVGSHLLYSLTLKGQVVKALRRKESDVLAVKELFAYYTPDADLLFSRIQWVEGDVLDIHALEESMAGVNQVYHCAALISFKPAERNKMLQVNVEGTANVVNTCLHTGVARLCHVSSIASLGRNSVKGLVTEETHWKTSPENSWYSISKYGAEREVWRGAEEGLEVVVVNPSVILGPGNWNNSSLVMFKLASQGLKYYTSGQTGYVDVRDVAEVMVKLMESGVKGERYILNSENVPLRVFFDRILEAFGKPKASVRVQPWLAEMGWRFEKVKTALLGQEPRITQET